MLWTAVVNRGAAGSTALGMSAGGPIRSSTGGSAAGLRLRTPALPAGARRSRPIVGGEAGRAGSAAMVVEPAFVRADGRRDLLVRARRLCSQPVVVRIWASETTGKTAKVAEFAQFELRPGQDEGAERRIASLGRPPFFLAVLVFQLIAPLTWERLMPKEQGPYEAPRTDWRFDGRAAPANPGVAEPGIELDILYA